ncbi:olfactory receptor 142 [Oryzias latipes]|uniref:olfactory receptor 142 n=1 Tax=Oryzias latipes TaxID=8090 RepID=UPI0005CC5B3B|nr:olfactory receptor 142 [Oryzias latipes]
MNNLSVIFLSGLNETRVHRPTLFVLSLLCYCLILLVNVSLVIIIILDKSLHEPMYILLCAFCINGLYGTTGFYPKFLWDLLSPVHMISYYGCLIQVQVMYSFACSDLSILSVMAYDRYVAICRPLEYRSLVSKQKVLVLVGFSWFTPFCIVAVNTCLTSSIKLCSRHLSRLFCVNWSIVRLACPQEEMTANNVVANITIIIYVCHGLFIVWSYMYLVKTCMNSIENRAKFMQTCVPHLVSLITFMVTILTDVISLRLGFDGMPQTLQNLIAIEFLLIPPIMNPLIYGFKLTKIRYKIIKLLTFRVK